MISQREARRLKARVEKLESIIKSQRARWHNEYPGGTHIGTLTRDRDWLSGRIEGARLMRHAVVVTETGSGKLDFYALPHPDVEA